ncbi:MAG: TIM44-like domain-containing protein [Bacteroidetes bacterium]|nr:TIM44-like domain-containing protein [Bacteroidota bacterium]
MKRSRIILLLIFLCHASLLFSRAGGGGGDGSSSSSSSGYNSNRYYNDYHNSYNDGSLSGIIFILFVFGAIALLIYFSYRNSIKTRKRKESSVILEAASLQDAMWNEAKLTELCRKIFMDMQYAWSIGSLRSVTDKITEKLYNDYTIALNDMNSRGEKNIIRNISIDTIEIIGAEDYISNDKDSFYAYIAGSLLDYTTRGDDIIKNQEKTRENFKDIYHFVRHENTWKLDLIINEPGIFDFQRARNTFEKK